MNPADEYAALVGAVPDAHATRDERVAWFEKKAEIFESMANLPGVDKDLALGMAAEARATVVNLRTGKWGEVRAVRQSRV